MLTSVLEDADGNAPMLHSRVFPLAPGEAEDITTGSSHCSIGPLYSPRFGGPGVEIRATQGGKRQGAISVVWDGKPGSEGGRVKLRGPAVTGMMCVFSARHLTDLSISAQLRRERCSYERVHLKAQYCAMARIHAVFGNAKIHSLATSVREGDSCKRSPRKRTLNTARGELTSSESSRPWADAAPALFQETKQLFRELLRFLERHLLETIHQR